LRTTAPVIAVAGALLPTPRPPVASSLPSLVSVVAGAGVGDLRGPATELLTGDAERRVVRIARDDVERGTRAAGAGVDDLDGVAGAVVVHVERRRRNCVLSARMFSRRPAAFAPAFE
jgi:hypothetical protein